MQPGDILLATDLDLQLSNGDFAFGDATRQHQRCLLLFGKGNLLDAPLSGVGLHNYLHSDDPAELLRETRQQYIKDGMEVSLLAIENGQLKVEAGYL